MVFVKNSDEGVFSPYFAAKSIIRLRSYPSSVGYAATFSPGGEGSCYSPNPSIHIHVPLYALQHLAYVQNLEVFGGV